MKLSNIFRLPDPIVNAAKGFQREYKKSRGKGGISVTQLISPPMIKQLLEKHDDELVEDVSDRIWSILGSATHSILEHAVGVNDLAEERLELHIGKFRITGQADLYESDGTLSDYKITSVWAVIDEDKPKPEWVAQLNILAKIYESAGFPVTKLQIVAILRDWSKGKAKRGNYPHCAIKVIPIPRWSDEEIDEYINYRLMIHSSEPEPCSDEERWAKPTVYAAMKKGRKSAMKLYDNEEEAKNHPGSTYVETRPGEHIRCLDYCPVRSVCPHNRYNLEGD